MNRTVSMLTGLACALLVTGCDRQATGQVAAVVGDDEITLQEINTEIGNINLPKGVDAKVVQQAALQRIIDRRLLAAVADDQGIDEQPDFILRKRQIEDSLLVQLLSEQIGRSVRVPNEAAIQKYIADRPGTFASRERLTLDQIRFPVPADMAQLRQLEDDHSMEAVVAKLNKLGIKFERGPAGLDTGGVPPALLAQIESLPAGEPFVVPQNGVVTVSVISSRQPTPLTGADASKVAAEMMRNDELGKALQQRLKAKKADMKIEYQPGFAPPKPDASPPASKK